MKEAANARHSAEDINIFSEAVGHATPPATPIDLGATMQLPSVASDDGGKLSMTTKDGEVLEVETQVQLYAPNNLLGHPLISSVGAYLGGLPPLFFVASDKEVLRDEVIYTSVPLHSSLPFPGADLGIQRPQGCQSEQIPDQERSEEAISDFEWYRSEVRPHAGPSTSLRRLCPRSSNLVCFHYSCQVLFPGDCRVLQTYYEDG